MSWHAKSRSSPLQAPAAGAPEALVSGKHYMAALFADKPFWPLQHCPEFIVQNAIRAANYFLTHFETFPSSPLAERACGRA